VAGARPCHFVFFKKAAPEVRRIVITHYRTNIAHNYRIAQDKKAAGKSPAALFLCGV
jgi:hypothetical protein